ncbi:MAG: hypothetical protein ACI4CT_03410 [Lachnospiraceae bacterium]
MINYSEEIKKFKLSPEIGQTEEEIYKNDVEDMMDLIERIVKDTK